MAKGKPQVAKKTQNNKKAAVAPAKPSSIVANKKNGVQKKPQQQQKKQQPKKQQKISKRVEEEDFDINDEDLMGEDELNRQLMEASSDEEIEGSDDDSDALPDSYEGEKVVGNKNASKKRYVDNIRFFHTFCGKFFGAHFIDPIFTLFFFNGTQSFEQETSE